MSRANVEIFADVESLREGAAAAIAAVLERALQELPAASVVLTGGNTPGPVYERLAAEPFRSRIDWSRLEVFWGDERPVPADHPESNYGLACRTLLRHVAVREERVHRMLGELEDKEKAARRYEAEVRRALPGAGVPRFDLVLLGMGDDGHTASLFPGTSWDEQRLVVANFVPKLDALRLTMTPRLLNRARTILFLVAGASKARALAGVLGGPAGAHPAQRIAPEEGDLVWMVDRAAASLLCATRT